MRMPGARSVAGLLLLAGLLAAVPSLAGTIAFIVIVSLTVCVTVDLNHPTRGLIRTSQEPMQRLLDSMGR